MSSKFSPVVDRIRIIPRSDDFLDRNVGSSGEVFYDRQSNSLRIYSGKDRGGFTLLTSGNFTQQIANTGVAVLEKTDTVNIARMEIRINRNSSTSIQAFHTTDGQAGNITITGTSTAYNTSSDYRLKENVVSISDGITRLKTLKPYRFNFKTDSTRTVDGFYAHEITAVPEAITGTKDATNEDGSINPQSIDQSKLVPLLTAALQEAIAKIEVLETKVAALEAG